MQIFFFSLLLWKVLLTNGKHAWLWTDGWHQVETIRCVAAVRAAAVSGDGKEAWQQMLVQFTEATTHYTQHESWTFDTSPVIPRASMKTPCILWLLRGYEKTVVWCDQAELTCVLTCSAPSELNHPTHTLTDKQRSHPCLDKLTCFLLAHAHHWRIDFELILLIVQPISRVVNGWLSWLNALSRFSSLFFFFFSLLHASSLIFGLEDGLPPDLQWEGTAALGPILLEEMMEVLEPPPQPLSLLQTYRLIQTGRTCGA